MTLILFISSQGGLPLFHGSQSTGFRRCSISRIVFGLPESEQEGDEHDNLRAMKIPLTSAFDKQGSPSVEVQSASAGSAKRGSARAKIAKRTFILAIPLTSDRDSCSLLPIYVRYIWGKKHI